MKSTPSAALAQAPENAERDGFEIDRDASGGIVIRIVAPPQSRAGSPLVALEEIGLEREAARRLRESGELPCVKIGRRWYAKRSDVEVMFDRLAVLAATPRPKPVKAMRTASTTDTLAALAAVERKASR